MDKIDRLIANAKRLLSDNPILRDKIVKDLESIKTAEDSSKSPIPLTQVGLHKRIKG